MEVCESPTKTNNMKANNNNMSSSTTATTIPEEEGGGGGNSKNQKNNIEGDKSVSVGVSSLSTGKENENIGLESDDGLVDSSELDPNEPILYRGSIFDPGDDDEDYLIDNKRPPFKENLKKSIKGFDEEEARICPLVDRKSSLLFDVVQNLEEEQINASIELLKSVNHSGPIPLSWIQEYVDPKAESNPEIWSSWHLRVLDEESSKSKKEDKIVAQELTKYRKILGDEKTIAGYAKALDYGWSREVVLRMHQPKLSEVSETNPMCSIGEVFYRDPAGNKIRSMKQIAMTLEKSRTPGLSIKNFSFAKAPIGVGDPKKENLRKILSGKLPTLISPARPPMTKGKKVMKEISTHPSSSIPRSTGPPPSKIVSTPEHINEPKFIKSSSSRRSIQPPKRYATGQAYIYPEKRLKPGPKSQKEIEQDHEGTEFSMGMLPPKYPVSNFDEGAARRRGRPPTKIKPTDSPSNGYGQEDDSALFQISAFHNHSQSTLFQGIDDAHHGDEDMYGGMPSMMETEGQDMQQDRSEELLPCSIRCPGMTGEIPTLQCKRCLCLYHPECLGLPPNLNFRNFLCQNCETEPTTNEELPSSPPKLGKPQQSGTAIDAMKRLLNRTGNKSGESSSSTMTTKKPPPPLLPAFPKFPMGNQSGAAGKMFRTFAPKMGGSTSMIQPSLFRGNQMNRRMTSSSMSLLRPTSTSDDMSISPIGMNKRGGGGTGRGRGRGRGGVGGISRNTGGTGIPQSLVNRNLTITPITNRQRMPPPLPNLTPMTNKSGLTMPYSLSSLPKMKTGQKLVTPIMPSSQKPKPSSSSLSLTQAGRLHDTILRGAPGTSKQKGTINIGFPSFKRHPQSVISIGTKKFVAVPRGNIATTLGIGKGKINSINTNSNINTNKKMTSGAISSSSQQVVKTIPQVTTTDESMTVTPIESMQETQKPKEKREGTEESISDTITVEPSFQHRFDSDRDAVQKIFKYLNVKDLLRASRVSQLWNAVATDVSLWKIVRMKNNRISDIEAFTQFLKKQQTQFVDFRKMISAGEMDWESLFKSLSDVPSLKQVQLGPRSEELISLLSQHCPHIQVVTS